MSDKQGNGEVPGSGGVAEVASLKPFYKELTAGRTYLWCACGRSKRQPFCDGRSHEGTGFEPVSYKCTKDGEEVLFCGCKQTRTPPFCDGAHNNLAGGYQEGEERGDLPMVAADAAGVRSLDGRCFVVAPDATMPSPAPQWWLRQIVGETCGAEHMSQFYARLAGGQSPILANPNGDMVMWVMRGNGLVEIEGTPAEIGPNVGILVRAGETFRLGVTGDGELAVHLACCPGTERLEERGEMGTARPRDKRVFAPDQDQREAMGPRYFEVLIDKDAGSPTATQFIGNIPLSIAAMHRHLYEEALIILNGEGVIWNDTCRAEIRAGDVIFFPRKHNHSVQCTSANGMDVVGLIHPGDNPGINY